MPPLLFLNVYQNTLGLTSSFSSRLQMKSSLVKLARSLKTGLYYFSPSTCQFHQRADPSSLAFFKVIDSSDIYYQEFA